MRVTKTILGKEYIFENLRIGAARKLRREAPDPSDYNVAFIAASLRAGGMEEATPEWVDDNLPFFENAFTEFLKAAYEACGMKLDVPEAGKPGEDQAAQAPPSDATPQTILSTSDTSTEASPDGSATE